MSPVAARRQVLGIIIFGAVLVAITRAIDDNKKVRIRLIIGALLVIIVLTMLSEVAPKLAVSMAALAGLSALFTAAPAIRRLAPTS